ncbi:MAG: c-type cytochrome [Chitinophagaceae bacterium]
MKSVSLKNKVRIPHLKMMTVMGSIAISVGILTSGFKEKADLKYTAKNLRNGIDSAASIAAFEKVYQVLMSPRCMNCHPAGDIPLQGDDNHKHTMMPRRGKDGKGLYAMKCANCHQPENSTVAGGPPGNPKWALPPADMKMVFEGRSPRELALQIMDYKRNGHKTKSQLIEHARDTLVKAGWNMGEGRKPPPLSYTQFVVAWDEWINTGGIAPW